MPRTPRPGGEAEALGLIWDRIRADPFWDHLRLDGIRLVPSVGSTRPVAFLVGEAPGATENTKGRPFCGASGRVLRDLMALAGLTEDNTYITNVIKYRPPGNRTPTIEEIRHGHEYLRQEFYAVGLPRVLIAAGGTARAGLLWSSVGTQGFKMPTWGKPYTLPQTDWTLWPMYHPAFPLRQKAIRPTAERHWEELGAWISARGLT